MNEPASSSWRGWLGRFLPLAGIVAGALLLALTGGFIAWEASWVEDRHYDEADAFSKGSIGTEIVPLAVLKVLPAIVPAAFQPGGPGAGDMIAQFGFLRRPPDDPHAGLPLGLTISNYRPLSGAPSPIPFVGIGCSACHTSALRHESLAAPVVIPGAGNPALDLIAWGNAVQAALTAKDETGAWRLTLDRIVAESAEEIPWIPDRIIIAIWLREGRAAAEAQARTYDAVETGPSLRDSRVAPAGPGRTTPFKALVRRLLRRPGDGDGFSKIPVALHQGWKVWAQFDGSIREPALRSALAAMTIQASRENMMQPEIGRNVVWAANHLAILGGPSFAQAFPAQAPEPAGAAVESGKRAYREHCADCHGRPESGGGWDTDFPRFGKVIALAEIRTDPRRVGFRHNTELPAAIIAHMRVFPLGHPFRVTPDQIRPNPENLAAFVPGYLAGPIDSAFARAPFLHNASVLSLAELINLAPRRKVFCRGAADYDPERVGLAYVPPDVDSGGNLSCDLSSRHYFLFDTRKSGNAATGHDYPWAYRGPGWNEPKLRDLLAYLKTL